MSALERFRQTFGTEPTSQSKVPGRVNLIGEHTDYNGGLVLPTVIPNRIEVALAPAEDRYFHIVSSDYEDQVRIPLTPVNKGHWSDHVIATFAKLIDDKRWHQGAFVAIDSTIPPGSGLSSSAALVVALLKAALKESEPDLDPLDLPKRAQFIENRYLGIPCGLMDQMAVAFARHGEALFLNMSSLHYELIELPQDHVFAVAHSGLYRTLGDGRYERRRRECEAAADALGVVNLSDASLRDKADLSGLPDNLQKRTRHVVSENERVRQAVSALKAGAPELFGPLMTASHDSMRDDFEVSLPLIDDMVAKAVELGALGARLTGGGFGGCFVSLLPAREEAEWKQKMTATFSEIRFI